MPDFAIHFFERLPELSAYIYLLTVVSLLANIIVSLLIKRRVEKRKQNVTWALRALSYLANREVTAKEEEVHAGRNNV